jgi:NAD(P)-dependent dehydrogenase (short-subunit alcohol dehydrogenase family)
VATALYRAGADVMICARYTDEISTALASISPLPGGRIEGRQCDVRDEGAVQELIERTTHAFGRLQILINNAGVAYLGKLVEMSSEDWRATIDTNLIGVFHCCRHAIPVMKQSGGGDIVNMASRSSVNAYAGGSAYCASKFGLLGLSEALNLEVRDDNIRVSCIMPGRVATDFAGEAPQDWHLSVDDVAQAVVDVLSFHPRALVSRLELRPAAPRH